MVIELQQIVYAILGGVGLVAVTKACAAAHAEVTGRNTLVKYSTFIKRHARNRRELENLISENKHLRSIVMQGVDAAYVALAGREPSVAVLYLNKPEDARLFRSCLDHLDDPETIYALALRQKATAAKPAADCKECKEFAAQGKAEATWFRISHGKDVIDEKIDDAMLEQVTSLARSRDKFLTQSGACHISLKMHGRNKHDDIVVLPTSADFRRSFRREYGTDDLTRFAAKDLFDRVLKVRNKMNVKH
jgi:hypothetical protein